MCVVFIVELHSAVLMGMSTKGVNASKGKGLHLSGSFNTLSSTFVHILYQLGTILNYINLPESMIKG